MLLSPKLRTLATQWLPPAVLTGVRRVLDYVRPAPWEYVPEGWRTVDPRIQGWNVESIARTQTERWPLFLEALKGTRPLGVSHESPTPSNADYAMHNTIMSFAYVLALAARRTERLSLLDWGGGIGHYYALSKALLPGVPIDYFCRDLPLLCQAGRALQPDATFLEDDESCRSRRYDLVLSSFSLPYSEDWRHTAGILASVTRSYLYITRLPVVQRVPSFVVVQRPYSVGYRTEYLGWFLNRNEFLQHLDSLNMELIREFLIQERPLVHRAPEQAHCAGFLFQPRG
ncbi:MAG: hypothetical protein QHJ73_00515 [Armatimonadota bacterium]|nr:hypothetical protein [Armatimonadota bacterium]